MKLKFLEFTERHNSIGKKSPDGKSVTYTCDKCPGWSRTFNFETGQMTSTEKDKYFFISHSGQVSALPSDQFNVQMNDPEITLPVNGDSDSFSIN